jgi:hypothetical protein
MPDDGQLFLSVWLEQRDVSARSVTHGAEKLRQLELTEDALRLMDIAPYPSRGRDSTHDGMLCLMEVLGRVFARRGIATADVAARLALAQSYPKRTLN